MLIALYPTKKACREAIGTSFKFRETSMFGAEYSPNGTLTVAHRPHITGKGREWFGNITLQDGIIVEVK